MSTIETAFNEHAAALRALGAALTTAESVRFEAPPGSAREGSRGVPNPTLDTVLDPRRSAVSDEVARAAVTLRQMTEATALLTSKVDHAVARWQGEA